MDRSHPLLDRLEATHAPAPLRDTALALLRLHWPAVRDVGDAPYALVKTLLPLSTASQLADLELSSPHLVPHTNGIWRQFCINEFIEIRKAVEDGRISARDEPRSWREQYHLEEIKREEKMQAIVSKMRGQINEYKTGRATTKEVDWRLEKRRKSGSTAPARPKTLMEKARQNSKQIKSIFAARRRPTPPTPAAATAAYPTGPASKEGGGAGDSSRFLGSPRKRSREPSESNHASSTPNQPKKQKTTLMTSGVSPAIVITTTKRTLPIAAATDASGPSLTESHCRDGTATTAEDGRAPAATSPDAVAQRGHRRGPPAPRRAAAGVAPTVEAPPPLPPPNRPVVIPRGIFMPKKR